MKKKIDVLEDPGSSIIRQVSLPHGYIAIFDAMAKKHASSRTALIRQAMRDYIVKNVDDTEIEVDTDEYYRKRVRK